MKEPKATWGKIKDWDELAPEHRELLNKELNPNYRPVKDCKIQKIPIVEANNAIRLTKEEPNIWT